MTRSGALSVSGPIKPVIRIYNGWGAPPRRRGIGLFWRRSPKRVPPAAAPMGGPASWALTINLFLKQAFALDTDGPGRSKLPKGERPSPGQLPSPVKLVWRAANLRVEHRTDLLRNVLRRLVLPEITSIERWRMLSPGAVEARPPVRPPIRSQLLPAGTWGGQRRGAEAVPPLLKPTRERHFQPLTVARQDRLSPILIPPSSSVRRSSELVIARSTGASRRRSVTTVMPSSRVKRPDAVNPLALQQRRPRPWPTVVRSLRQGSVEAASMPARLNRNRPNPPVELVWSSSRAEAAATSLLPGMATPVGPSITREIGRDLRAMNSVPSAVQTGAPDVDRLVDEVFRRMDRQFRSERLRRGL